MSELSGSTCMKCLRTFRQCYVSFALLISFKFFISTRKGICNYTVTHEHPFRLKKTGVISQLTCICSKSTMEVL